MKAALFGASVLWLGVLAPAQADSLFGNQFQVGSDTTAALVDSSWTNWARFTAVEPMAVTAVQIRLQDAATSSLTVGLQGDNGSGVPDGKYLASETVKSVQDGWNRVALRADLKAGAVYHLVVTIRGPGSVGWQKIGTINRGTQPAGAEDSQWASGEGRKPNPKNSFLFVLELQDGRSFGQAYVQKLNAPTLGGRKVPAQHFVFQPPSSGETAVASASFYLTAGHEGATSDYTVALLDGKKHEILESVTVPAGEIANGSAQIYTFAFSGNTRLTPGESYVLAIYSDSPTGSVAWVQDSGEAGEVLENATWEGRDGYAFRYTDTALKIPGEPEYARDFVFYLTLQP